MIEDTAPEQPREVREILEQIQRRSDTITAIRANIRSLEDKWRVEEDSLLGLYDEYASKNQLIAAVASQVLQDNPAPKPPDKRKERNPIKELAIGINLSYRHSKNQGYDKSEAFERAVAFVLDKAIKRMTHTDRCKCPVCSGKIESPHQPIFATNASNLPIKALDYLRKCHDEYHLIGTAKRKKALHA